MVDWFGNATYAATPIGDQHLAGDGLPGAPLQRRETGQRHRHGAPRARGNYAACYGKGGYGSVYDEQPGHRRALREQLQGRITDITTALSNTLALSELKYRHAQRRPALPTRTRAGSGATARWAATPSAPRTARTRRSPDGVWGCRNFPPEGMPCAQIGSPYSACRRPPAVTTPAASTSPSATAARVRLATRPAGGLAGAGPPAAAARPNLR